MAWRIVARLLARAASLDSAAAVLNCGITTAARMPRMITTISNSTSVKPDWLRRGLDMTKGLRMKTAGHARAKPCGQSGLSAEGGSHLRPLGPRAQPEGSSPGTTPSQGSSARIWLYTQAEPTYVPPSSLCSVVRTCVVTVLDSVVVQAAS